MLSGAGARTEPWKWVYPPAYGCYRADSSVSHRSGADVAATGDGQSLPSG